MSGRAIFQVVAALILGVVLVAVVVRPAVERGGWGELILIGSLVAIVLLAERWMRGR